MMRVSSCFFTVLTVSTHVNKTCITFASTWKKTTAIFIPLQVYFVSCSLVWEENGKRIPSKRTCCTEKPFKSFLSIKSLVLLPNERTRQIWKWNVYKENWCHWSKDIVSYKERGRKRKREISWVCDSLNWRNKIIIRILVHKFRNFEGTVIRTSLWSNFVIKYFCTFLVAKIAPRYKSINLMNRQNSCG